MNQSDYQSVLTRYDLEPGCYPESEKILPLSAVLYKTKEGEFVFYKDAEQIVNFWRREYLQLVKKARYLSYVIQNEYPENHEEYLYATALLKELEEKHV